LFEMLFWGLHCRLFKNEMVSFWFWEKIMTNEGKTIMFVR